MMHLLLFALLSLLFFPACVGIQSLEDQVNNAKHRTKIAQVAILPAHFKPSREKHRTNRRLIFIGDVHGAYDELVSLLDKVKYQSPNDHVVFLGDMVDKGPQPLEVVRLAMSLNASCVVGNHDYDLLNTLGYIQTVGDNESQTEDVPNELVVGLEEHTLGKRFERKAAEWMLRCPYILKVGDVGGEELIAVHAGLLPGKPLKEQEPWTIMNIRNIVKGKGSRDTEKGVPWAKVWNKAQRRAKQPTTVIYGHDARRGLQLRKHTKGLDTGCVKGGRLTALIYPGAKIVSVRCKDYLG